MPEATKAEVVKVPQWILGAALTLFVALVGVWVKSTAADEATAMISTQSEKNQKQFEQIADHGTRIIIVETNMTALTDSVNKIEKVSSGNRDLLIRIATKLNVETDGSSQ